ncbi:CLUMA_CG006241, isoform A [Clunio marinus]|uniref:CLUMA_CG006241, isoform A n=1 Tax=Clunio marinus TaxID=568069 RepID=A0A1J1HX43_9DIPT|nr:CLUMA_CG006241, isoform A [Clunio marinus]
MSHSTFRIIANDEPINRNLVIIVNKNGQVATDTEALQNLLTSKGFPNTGVSILRETSPTPSIVDEINQEKGEKLEQKRQEYLDAHRGEEIDEEEFETFMKQFVLTMNNEIPHVTLNVENFYTPSQARKFANDVLHLGGIDNPQSLMPIDYNFRREIVQNDHCYTSLTMSPQHIEKQTTNKKGRQKTTGTRDQKHSLAKMNRQQAEEESSENDEATLEEDEEFEEELSEEEEEISFSESDDDNDHDFSVNDRFGKKGKKKRKYRKNKQRMMTFKDFLETGDVSNLDDEPKKKYIKTSTAKKTSTSRPSTSGKNVLSTSSKNTHQPSTIKKVISMPTNLKNNLVVPKEITTVQFVPLTTKTQSINTQLPTQISVHTAQLPSVTKISMSNSTSTSSIPNIMQMMENNTPAEIIDQSLSSLEQMDSSDGAVPGMEEIGDALIAVLGNEALEEILNQNELMNFDSAQQNASTTTTSSIINLKSPHNNVSSTPTEIVTSSIASDVISTSIKNVSFPTTTSIQMPKILNKQAPEKNPIRIVRNGRLITLPPITPPTTRGAKRRAEEDSPNTSLVTVTNITPTSVGGKVVKTEKSPSTKDPDSRNSSRRSSLNKSESGKKIRRQSVIGTSVDAPDDDLDDLNSDASWDSEDDPERLWCICKQPHNNRFMICCDKCEDWFHGKCVNVTKASAKEFEAKGKEWRCPNCRAAENDGGTYAKKIDPNKKPLNQQKLTKFFAKSQKESTDEDIAKTVCVVCKQKSARDSSIYCSDECIQNHATKHIDDNSQSSQPSKHQQTLLNQANPETKKRGNVLKDKSGNVIVYDKMTGKILPLKQSPHFTVLGKWLHQNPTYEPVKPGSSQAQQLLARNRNQSEASTSSIQTQKSTSQQQSKAVGEDLFSNPIKINSGATPSPTIVANVKKSPSQSQHSGNSVAIRSVASVKNTSGSNNVRQAISGTVSSSANQKSSQILKPDVVKKVIKRQVSESESQSYGSSSGKCKTEQERLSVRNILRDTLKNRMQEFDHPQISRMNDEEIADFSKETERQMFLFFNKDTRDKYKTKYRSLKFNLGDVKNKTLLEKICAKKLTPKQLVELPSAALASEELAKWREDENKHQLEIITKSELESLAQNKIVVKTHKGEEIIETKSAPTDILVPVVDDVESVIAKTVLSVDDPHGRYDLSRSISLNASGGSGSDSKNIEVKSMDNVKTSIEHIQPDQQDVDLVGRILDSMGVHLDTLSSKTEKKKEETGTLLKPELQTNDIDVMATTSNVFMPVDTIEPVEKRLPIEIYSGNMHMADVASFDVTASVVSGNVDDILKLLPAQLEIAGRIEPHTVWDYLEKVKKMTGKELCILRFSSTDVAGYFNFFSYLHSRERYGVIKVLSPKIKDFYVVPVEANRPVPKVLLPLIGPGFVEGEDHKPDLLLGVILKISSDNKIKKPNIVRKSISKNVAIEHPIQILPSKHKHGSKLTIGLPEFSNDELQLTSIKQSHNDISTDDGNEPYTPFDDEDEATYAQFPSKPTTQTSTNEDLESQMEIIQRQIEQRQLEIQSLAQQKAMELNEEQATRIFEKIKVPENLSEILSKISKQGNETKSLDINEGDEDDDEEYVPTTIGNIEYRSSSFPSLSQQLTLHQQHPPIVNSMMDIDERIAMFQNVSQEEQMIDHVSSNDNQPSRLANMTADDLMKLVPDGALDEQRLLTTTTTNSGIARNQPPIPGLDDNEYMN